MLLFLVTVILEVADYNPGPQEGGRSGPGLPQLGEVSAAQYVKTFPKVTYTPCVALLSLAPTGAGPASRAVTTSPRLPVRVDVRIAPGRLTGVWPLSLSTSATLSMRRSVEVHAPLGYFNSIQILVTRSLASLETLYFHPLLIKVIAFF